MWERIEVRGITLIPTFSHRGRRGSYQALTRTWPRIRANAIMPDIEPYNIELNTRTQN